MTSAVDGTIGIAPPFSERTGSTTMTSTSSFLSREGMDSIKTALLVLIVKERLRKERPEANDETDNDTIPLLLLHGKRPRRHQRASCRSVTDALDQFTGNAALLARAPRPHWNGDTGTTVHPGGRHCRDAFPAVPFVPLWQADPFAAPAAPSLIAHDSPHQWEAHLHHILQIIWRQPMGIMSDRLRSLCRHVACQLDAVVATSDTTTTASDDDNNHHQRTRLVTEWLWVQWTGFRVSISHKSSSDANNTWWATIWHTILQSSPTAMSELMVPQLLDMVLQCGPKPSMRGGTVSVPILFPPAAERTASSSNNSNNDSMQLRMVSLHPVLAWHLLERALVQAPEHVLVSTEHTLLPSTTTCVEATFNNNNNNHGPPPDLSLVPTRNSTWYCTQDLAHDMLLFHHLQQQQQQQQHPSTVSLDTICAGDFFLLGHGLASLSEMLSTPPSVVGPCPSNNKERQQL